MTALSTVVIAVVNSKGGVGRTTVSVNLAAALSATGRRVLLVDLDSQACASLWCGVPRERLTPSIATCLLQSYPIQKAIRTTATPDLDLVTGSIELASVDVALCHVAGREATLKAVLRSVRQRYQAVLLDCPPGLSLVGINALVAADAFIVPVAPQTLAVEALAGFLEALGKARAGLGTRGRLLGLLLTLMDPRREGTGEFRERLRAQHRDRLFQTEIRVSRALDDAAAARKPVQSYAPQSSVAQAFVRLADEVLTRLA